MSTLRDVDEAILIPVKAFDRAKVRLSGHFVADDRATLARLLAEGVIAAVGDLATFVACDDERVAEWAESRGATVLWGPGLGLNEAVNAGVARIARRGFDHVTICHGDLAMPGSLPSVAEPNTIVLVPDQRRDGTNVLSRPIAAATVARYGPGSFDAHLAEAIATGLPVRVRVDEGLALDIDTIDDLQNPLVAERVGALLDDPSD